MFKTSGAAGNTTRIDIKSLVNVLSHGIYLSKVGHYWVNVVRSKGIAASAIQL